MHIECNCFDLSYIRKFQALVYLSRTIVERRAKDIAVKFSDQLKQNLKELSFLFFGCR